MPDSLPSRLADDPDRLLTYGHVATIALVPERSVRGWVAKGTGPPALRLGRHVRFRVRDVLAWLDEQGDIRESA